MQDDERFDWRHFFELSTDLEVGMRRDGTIEVANSAWQRTLGVPPEELIGSRLERWCSPLDAAALAGEIERARQMRTLDAAGSTTDIGGLEVRMPSDFSGERRVRWRFDGQSDPDVIYGVGRDVTRQLRERDDRRSVETRFQVVLETVDDLIVSLDPAGRVRGVHGRGTGTLPVDVEDIIGRRPAELVTGEDADDVAAAVSVALGGRPVELDWSFELGGVARIVHTSITPIAGTEGEIEGAVAVLRDVTDERRIRKALEESEERYRRLVEASPDGIVVHQGGVVVFANDACARLIGFDRGDELLDSSIANFVHPDDRRLVAERNRRLHEVGEGPLEPADMTLLTKDGEPVEVETTAVKIQYHGGPATQVVLRDVRERKRAERALRKREEQYRKLAEQLRETNRELEGFAYTVSHDLRAPLRAMQGFAVALLEDYGVNLDATGRDYAERIVSASERLASLIRDLLDYSRMARQQPSLKVVDLDELLADVVFSLEGAIKAADADVDVADDLGLVMGNKLILVQVFTNLFVNSLKFVREGERPVIRVTSDSSGSRVRVYVEDEGIGIAEEHRDRVFGLFERLHSGDAFPGTGVGLAIARKGVRRLGGDIDIVDAQGPGTRFVIRLAKPGGGLEGGG